MTETKVSSAGCCYFFFEGRQSPKRYKKRRKSRRVENATGKRIYIAKRRSETSHVGGNSGKLDDLPEEERRESKVR